MIFKVFFMVKSLWSNNITDMSYDRKFPCFYFSVVTSGQKEEKKQAKKKKKDICCIVPQCLFFANFIWFI